MTATTTCLGSGPSLAQALSAAPLSPTRLIAHWSSWRCPHAPLPRKCGSSGVSCSLVRHRFSSTSSTPGIAISNALMLSRSFMSIAASMTVIHSPAANSARDDDILETRAQSGARFDKDIETFDRGRRHLDLIGGSESCAGGQAEFGGVDRDGAAAVGTGDATQGVGAGVGLRLGFAGRWQRGILWLLRRGSEEGRVGKE